MIELSLGARTRRLVTGGSRAQRRVIAAGFLRHGARVCIGSRKAAPCEAAAQELPALGPCLALPADVASVAAWRELAAELGRREPALDIAIHSAGAVWNEDFGSLPEAG